MVEARKQSGKLKRARVQLREARGGGPGGAEEPGLERSSIPHSSPRRRQLCSTAFLELQEWPTKSASVLSKEAAPRSPAVVEQRGEEGRVALVESTCSRRHALLEKLSTSARTRRRDLDFRRRRSPGKECP